MVQRRARTRSRGRSPCRARARGSGCRPGPRREGRSGRRCVKAAAALALMPGIFSRGRRGAAREKRPRAPGGRRVSSGWNVAAVTLPLRTRTGSPSRRASTSTSGVDGRDPRGADEDGLERLGPEDGAVEIRQPHDRRVELPTVGVPRRPSSGGGRSPAPAAPPRPGRGGSPPRRCRGRDRRGRATARIASSIPVPSMSRRSVVDSPPGITSPVDARIWSAVRTSHAPTPARRSASRCASKSP